MGRSTFLQRLRTAGLLLALFALTFKALLPPGYMLTPAADQTVAVTLCTLNGAVDLAMPRGDAPDEHGDHDERSAPPCVFATIGALDVPTPAPAPAPFVVATAFEWPPAIVRAAPGLAAPPPWPTGPPISI